VTTRLGHEVTLTLDGATADLMLAALKVFGTIAGDCEHAKDTDATAECWAAYCELIERVYGSSPSHRITEVDSLAGQLERDMLAIVHREYKRDDDAFTPKDCEAC
jgi:hypothetical protein